MYLTIKDGKLAVDRETDFKTLDALHAFVGGYLEAIRIPSPSNRELVGYINEEGKLQGLAPNFYSVESQDIIVGPCVIVALEMVYEDGFPVGKDNVPLTEEEIKGLALVTRNTSPLPTLFALRKE